MKDKKRAAAPRIRSDGYAKDIVYSLEIDRIRANSAQPRRDFDMESIIKLADSIRRYGILQPLSVRRFVPQKAESHRKKNLVADLLSVGARGDVSRETSKNEAEIDCFGQLSMQNLPELPVLEEKTPISRPRGDTGEYELVAGERRLRAAKMLGMRSVPCIIVDVNDAMSAELALVENMLRENLNMFEQAAAFSRLAEKYRLTQEEIAAKMSLSQSAVANKIRLLKLTDEERQLIIDASLTERHARAFLRVPDAEMREMCIHKVIDDKFNVCETDKYITNLLSNPASPQKIEHNAVQVTPERLCSNIYKFVNRIQSASGNCLTVNRKSDGQNVIITLTVHKSS